MPITLTGIRAVVFDLDDTLYPECEYAYSGFAAVGDWLRSRMACPTDPARRLMQMFQSGRRGRLFDDLLAEWRCSNAAELIPEMVACYRHHQPTIVLHADAQRAMDRWRGLFQLALITDGPLATQRRKIEALDLSARLDLIICTDQWGRDCWKPSPKAFNMVEQAWAIHGPQCIYIADNPAKDFVAPNLLSWHSVLIQRPAGEYCRAPAAPGGAPEFRTQSIDDIALTS